MSGTAMKGWPAFFSVNPFAEIAAFGFCFQNSTGFHDEPLFYIGRFYYYTPDGAALNPQMRHIPVNSVCIAMDSKPNWACTNKSGAV